MNWKHAVATLLKHCGTCRAAHLMRTVPPQQIEAFIGNFDSTIRGAFEDLLGSNMGDHSWKITKFPPNTAAWDGTQEHKPMVHNKLPQ